MLTSSIVLEIFIILPAMKGDGYNRAVLLFPFLKILKLSILARGLDLNSTCGLDFLGQVGLSSRA